MNTGPDAMMRASLGTHRFVDLEEIKTAALLPPPKALTLNILRLCAEENVVLPDLARLIQGDPLLAGSIVKLANSAGLNRTRPVMAVTGDVLILVGIDAIRQLVLGISLVTAHRNGLCPAFDYGKFWSRSIAMACASQALGHNIRVAAPTELFMCGLLAGIGELAFASLRPSSYSEILTRNAGCKQDLITAEIEKFGMNHLEMAAAMMIDWKIPRLFAQAVAIHEQTAPPLDNRQSRLAGLLNIAARIADLCVAVPDDREELVSLLPEAVGWANIDRQELAFMMLHVSRAWSEWGKTFGIKTSHLPVSRLFNV